MSLFNGLLTFLILTFLAPVYVYFTENIDLTADYRTANRESAKIAPDAAKTKEAVIQVYSARTFNWRGLFAVHTWMVTKMPNAKHYTVYQKIGWRLLAGLPPVVAENDIPDRHWFAQRPKIILDIRGKRAEDLIEKIQAAVKRYPYPNDYSYWPGPNSNTFIAYIAREVPELHLVMPSIAIGKDYLVKGIFARAASGTGYQFSLKGLVGVTLAGYEGIEINLLGLVYGISPWQLAIKWPAIGEISPSKKKLVPA